MLLGAGAAALSKVVARIDPSLASLAWRLPFILGGIFGLCAAYLRRHLSETPSFQEMKKEQVAKHVPIAEVVKNYRRQCLFAVALVFVFSTTSGTYFQYLPTYLIGQLHFSSDIVFKANIVGILFFVIGMPLWGALRDRLGWSRTLARGTVCGTSAALWFFNTLDSLNRNDLSLSTPSSSSGSLPVAPMP